MKQEKSYVGVALGALLAAACATSTVIDDGDAGDPYATDSGADTGSSHDSGHPADASAMDSSVADATTDDGGDASVSDGGKPDATSKDGGAMDGGGMDASSIDAGPIAVVQINEVNPNITGSADLIELYVTTAGNTLGITIEENITGVTTLATLPDLSVSAGDFVVVHLNAPSGVKTESASKTDCTDAACYSGAWDVVGGTTGITYSGRVLVARDPKSNIQDGVAFYNSSATSPKGFYLDVESLQTAAAWLPADCGGVPCSTNALAEGISANWVGCGTAASGKSVARASNADTDKAGDWAVGASSFGATNP